MISKIIRNFVAKIIAGRSDDGIMITLKDPKKVEFQGAMIEDLLMRNGIDPRAITSEDQLKMVLNQIEAVQKQSTTSGIKNVKKAKVFDLEGKEIPEGSRIMGGKAADDLPPPGSRGGPDDIAAPVQSAEEATTNLTNSTIQKIKKLEPIEAMKEANKVIKREGIYKALDKKQAKKILDDTEDHIFERDVKPSEFDPDIEDFAIGGRVGLKRGSYLFEGGKKLYKSMIPESKGLKYLLGATEGEAGIAEILRLLGLYSKGGRVNFAGGSISRRAFLKLLGAAGAGIGAAKTGILKLLGSDTGEKAVKEIIKTSDVPGKPKWFDSLVNKVIAEGDDVTKNYATKDREIVHMKKIDDETTVRVTQDLDEDMIMVDIDDPVRNVMGEQGDTSIMLRFKKGKADETTKGKPPDEFDATEADMRNYMDGPDDYTTEFVDNTVTDVKDLTSDLTKIKSYATGKKPTMKELVESKKRREAVKYAEERPAEYAADRGPQYDYGDEDIELYTDYARGGLAGMLGE